MVATTTACAGVPLSIFLSPNTEGGVRLFDGIRFALAVYNVLAVRSKWRMALFRWPQVFDGKKF